MFTAPSLHDKMAIGWSGSCTSYPNHYLTVEHPEQFDGVNGISVSSMALPKQRTRSTLEDETLKDSLLQYYCIY